MAARSCKAIQQVQRVRTLLKDNGDVDSDIDGANESDDEPSKQIQFKATGTSVR